MSVIESVGKDHTSGQLARCPPKPPEAGESRSCPQRFQPFFELLKGERQCRVLDKGRPSLIQHAFFFGGHFQGIQFRRQRHPKFVHQLQFFSGGQSPHFRKIGQRHTQILSWMAKAASGNGAGDRKQRPLKRSGIHIFDNDHFHSEA